MYYLNCRVNEGKVAVLDAISPSTTVVSQRSVTSGIITLEDILSPVKEKTKLNDPKSVLLFHRDECSFYSVKTHSKDSRCLVIVDLFQNVKQCLAQKCQEVRAAYVNSGNAEMFSCEHTALCEEAVPPIKECSLTDQLIDSYPCDQATKAALHHLKQSNTGPAVFQVSSVSFCVNGVATASNSVGFCHIRNTNSKFLCTSSDCARYASKTKAAKHKKICMHQHVLLCVLQSSGEPGTASGSPSPNETATCTFSNQSAASSGSSNETATCIFSSQSVASSCSSNEAAAIFSSQSAASSGSSNETATFSSQSAASKSGSTSETPTFPCQSRLLLVHLMKWLPCPVHLRLLLVHLMKQLPSQVHLQLLQVYVMKLLHSPVHLHLLVHLMKQLLLQLQEIQRWLGDRQLYNARILQNILRLDSQTVLNGLGGDGWPSVYKPKEEICALCGVSLSSAHPHPGQKTEDGGFLITNAVPFQKIKILVKHCPKCKALVQVFPYDLGKST